MVASAYSAFQIQRVDTRAWEPWQAVEWVVRSALEEVEGWLHHCFDFRIVYLSNMIVYVEQFMIPVIA